MPDHPPVLEYRRPAKSDPWSVLRVLGGVVCIVAALATLLLAGAGALMLLDAWGHGPREPRDLVIGLMTTGVGILVAMAALHGAYAAFRRAKPAVEEAADERTASTEATDA